MLESILWTPEEGFFLLDAHLNRLRESAEYFGIELDETAVRQTVVSGGWRVESGQSPGPIPQSPEKIRLLVAEDGTITIEVVPLSQGAMAEPIRIGLAVAPVDSDDIWLYHKTTQRQIYEQARASRPDCDEVILWNERGEITEAGSSNVVIELEDQLWTPPVASGLLAGTFREQLLTSGRIQERVITVAEFQLSPRIFLINSVRGWQTAVISSQTVPTNNILATF